MEVGEQADDTGTWRHGLEGRKDQWRLGREVDGSKEDYVDVDEVHSVKQGRKECVGGLLVMERANTSR